MGVLGGWAFSYELGTPVPSTSIDFRLFRLACVVSFRSKAEYFRSKVSFRSKVDGVEPLAQNANLAKVGQQPE